MPVKTHKTAKKHPHHYAKVYWPYLPLVLLIGLGIWLGHPLVERSQRGVLAYSTNVTTANLLIDSNQVRTKNGQSQLHLNEQLNAAAQAKAQDMVDQDYWSHITPDRRTPWTFIDAAGYNYQKAGENLAYGFTDSDDVIKGWLNSPTHKANMLDSNYQEVGFGIATSDNFQGKGPETVIVALYGTPAEASIIDSGVAGFNTSQSNLAETNKTITMAQTLTGGRAPWITFALGLAAGIALAVLVLKNSVLIHRTIKKGERFVLKHPIIDLTVIAFVAFCAVLSQSVGLIR